MNVRLYISIPSNRPWQARFGISLALLLARLSGQGIKGHVLKENFLSALGQASNLSLTRQKFADDVLNKGFTHWLSLDDDMSFPADIIDRLIAHDKDLVAVNSRHKMPEIRGTLEGMDRKPVNSTGKRGLEEVNAIGGAIWLLRASALARVTRPCFCVPWDDNRQTYISEDRFFSLRLSEAGVKLYCDHDVSQEIGHVGDVEFKFPAQHRLMVAA